MAKFFRTMRFKLAAVFLLCAAAFQLVLMVVLPALNERSTLGAVDEAMERYGRQLSASIASAPDPVRTAETVVLEADRTATPFDFMVQVRRADGAIVGSSADLGGHTLPLDPDPNLPGDGLSFDMLAMPLRAADEPEREGTFRVRVATFAVRAPGGQVFYVQVAKSLALADRVGDSLQMMLLVALPIGLLLAAGIGMFVADLLVRRIESLREAVRKVSPQRLNETLQLPRRDDELGLVVADINGMLQRLATAFRSQEMFISNVSHELKTPVAALLTEAQVLKYAPADEETYKSFVLSVEDEMRRLGTLVESFLMLARFAHGKRFVAEHLVSLNDAALDSVEHSALLADQTQVTLRLTLYDPGDGDTEAVVRGDNELLRVVIDNLVRNAIQFSKAGDTVSIRIGVDGGHATIEVADEGPGVQPEFIDRIFDRFAQAPNANTGRRGTGLGLTIAKGIVELHRGAIDLKNRPERGCVFTVRLPLDTAPLPTPAGPAGGFLGTPRAVVTPVAAASGAR